MRSGGSYIPGYFYDRSFGSEMKKSGQCWSQGCNTFCTVSIRDLWDTGYIIQHTAFHLINWYVFYTYKSMIIPDIFYLFAVYLATF
jgi:hypothetical protein